MTALGLLHKNNFSQIFDELIEYFLTYTQISGVAEVGRWKQIAAGSTRGGIFAIEGRTVHVVWFLK